MLSCGATSGPPLLGRETPVDDQLAAGHKGGLVGGQEKDSVGYLLRLGDASQGNVVQTALVQHRVARRAAFMSVATDPGCTELARMPSRAYWMAVDLVSNRTAPLEALYTGWMPSWPMMPEMEEMLMMEPPPPGASREWTPWSPGKHPWR